MTFFAKRKPVLYSWIRIQCGSGSETLHRNSRDVKNIDDLASLSTAGGIVAVNMTV